MTFNKPPEWGKRFEFPENVQIEYNGLTGSVTSEIAVKMAERYDDAVAEQIAMEAKLAGVASCTVLNKVAILDALNKRTPKKPRVDDNDWYCCRNCGDTFSLINMVNDRNKFCGKCGQAIDWEDSQ